MNPTSATPPRARYLMIGGFLGAGKSTSILKLARHLVDQGLSVGLITNDQGNSLVDTQQAAHHGFPVEEIAGGCFCCRFNTLVEAADNLTQANKPDVFIAEPVGSCTDLIASVSYPLRRIYGDRFSLAPLSVVLDPQRALGILGLDDRAHFSKKVAYIYLKQLEEASLLVINKADTCAPDQLQRLQTELARRFPQARILTVSARTGQGLDTWFQILTQEDQLSRAAMDVDYTVYGEGEALLGWLNATLAFQSSSLLDGQEVLQHLADQITQHLEAHAAEIAHLKMTLAPDDGSGELAVINRVGNHYTPELAQRLSDPLQSGQLIVNLRAEGDPATLDLALQKARAAAARAFPGLSLELEHLEHFRPGQPVPVYRLANETDALVPAT